MYHNHNDDEHLSLTDDGLDDDPVLSYTLEQLRHHEAA
jgi:hypothetical protein